MPVAARPAERLGPHLLLGVVCAVVVAALIALVALSLRRRARRAAEFPGLLGLPGLPELAAAPRPFPIPLIPPMAGVGLGTTLARGWQDAGVGGVLGGRRAGELTVTCGGIDLAGWWLPRPVLRSVRIDERFATKFMPGTGLLVFGWEAGGCQYESGFRGAASGYEEVVAAVRGLLEVRVTEGSS